MSAAIDFKTFIPKFDAILERGLSNGLGKQDGQMCIEAAVCAALDLPHSDDPQCVAESVRSFKIALNDSSWSSPEARAKGLRQLGIAQVGSKGVVSDVEFSKRIAEQTIRVLIPTLFRDVLKDYPECIAAADRCEREGTQDAADDAANAANAAYAAADAASAAYAAAADAAYATDAARAAAYATDAARAADDKYLILGATLALEVLRELKSPGCEWL